MHKTHDINKSVILAKTSYKFFKSSRFRRFCYQLVQRTFDDDNLLTEIGNSASCIGHQTLNAF